MRIDTTLGVSVIVAMTVAPLPGPPELSRARPNANGSSATYSWAWSTPKARRTRPRTDGGTRDRGHETASRNSQRSSSRLGGHMLIVGCAEDVSTGLLRPTPGLRLFGPHELQPRAARAVPQ